VLSDGVPLGHIAIYHDISEHRRAEESGAPTVHIDPLDDVSSNLDTSHSSSRCSATRFLTAQRLVVLVDAYPSATRLAHRSSGLSLSAVRSARPRPATCRSKE
jgi:hypothetical protein